MTSALRAIQRQTEIDKYSRVRYFPIPCLIYIFVFCLSSKMFGFPSILDIIFNLFADRC